MSGLFSIPVQWSRSILAMFQVMVLYAVRRMYLQITHAEESEPHAG
jgi:hypothetical protein